MFKSSFECFRDVSCCYGLLVLVESIKCAVETAIQRVYVHLLTIQLLSLFWFPFYCNHIPLVLLVLKIKLIVACVLLRLSTRAFCLLPEIDVYQLKIITCLSSFLFWYSCLPYTCCLRLSLSPDSPYLFVHS